MYGAMKTTICNIIGNYSHYQSTSLGQKEINTYKQYVNTEVCSERPPPPLPSLWLHAQPVGDGHDHFEDGHEGGDLAEVAAADHLGVDLQATLVVLARHTAADLMEPVEDVGRERLISQLVI